MTARYAPGLSYADIGGCAACVVVDQVSGEAAYVALASGIAGAELRAEKIAALLNDDEGRPDFHWPDERAANDSATVLAFPVRR